jgi:3-deoxy-manno-octulosonate cytidylyltransferase (CMP-KDO synthetase)
MNIIGIIPARMGSSRFPGKPLASIIGLPMIGHVYFRSKMNKLMKEVYVATCDREIEEYVKHIGGKVVMTSTTHERASDRVAEALLKIENDEKIKVDIVVMIQGDEPMLHPKMIDEAVRPMLEEPSIMVTNLMAPLKTVDKHNDVNKVKVVVDCENFALYFSREPIPSRRKGALKDIPMQKQVCIIPFRRDFLLKFNELKPTPLEKIESVDMLRILEHGYKVKMISTRYEVYSVDTREDLIKVEELMLSDPLTREYLRKNKRDLFGIL